MERAHGEWAALWLQSGHVDDLEEERLDRQVSELRGAIQKVKAEHGDSLGTMETWQIDKAAAKAKANTGRGVDQMRPADIIDLPPVAKAELAQLFKRCEEAWMWPRGLCINRCHLSRKPTGASGVWHPLHT
jgi:hypothetical protein